MSEEEAGAAAPSSSVPGGTPGAAPPQSASEAVGRLFDELASHRPDPSLAAVSGEYEFDIAGGGRWFASLADGALATHAKPAHVDCLIECGADDFVEILDGRRNLVTSYMQGRVTCVGDVALALAFQRLLPVRR